MLASGGQRCLARMSQPIVCTLDLLEGDDESSTAEATDLRQSNQKDSPYERIVLLTVSTHPPGRDQREGRVLKA